MASRDPAPPADPGSDGGTGRRVRRCERRDRRTRRARVADAGRPGRVGGHLETLLGELADNDWPTLVVGPPPVADAEQTARIADLSARYADACAAAGAAWIPVLDPLRTDDVWTAEVRAGDGSHPGAAGYERLADLVAPAWRTWLDTV